MVRSFLHSDVDMGALANATAGAASFSGADIAGVVRDAAAHAMQRVVSAAGAAGAEGLTHSSMQAFKVLYAPRQRVL